MVGSYEGVSDAEAGDDDFLQVIIIIATSAHVWTVRL